MDLTSYASDALFIQYCLAVEQELCGQSVVITGAGSGIGRAIAELFANHGAHVIGVDRKEELLRDLVATITSQGGSASYSAADVTDGQALERIMSHVLVNQGRLDILVNNAGIIVPVTPLAEFSEQQFDRIMNTNIKGVFLGMRQALPHMIAAGRGVILNVSSVTSTKTLAGLGPYSASKRAVTSLTQAAALEAGPYGVRVNELLPGPTLTQMVTGSASSPSGAEAEFAKRVPLGRVSAPSEQAEAALFLVSNRSSFVNGASLLVDGGFAWV